MKPDELTAILDGVLIGLVKKWRCQFPERGKVLTLEDEAICDFWLRQFLAQPTEISQLEPRLQPWILVRLLTAIGALKKMSQDGEALPAVAPAALAEYFLISAWHRDLKFRWRGLADDSRIGQN